MLEGGEHIMKDMTLEEYKGLETRLYGEVIKSCRRYSHKLSMISILGILDVVKEEIKELEKTNVKLMKEDFFEEERAPVTEQETDIDPLDRM